MGLSLDSIGLGGVADFVGDILGKVGLGIEDLLGGFYGTLLNPIGDLLGSLVPLPTLDVPGQVSPLRGPLSTSNRALPYGAVPRLYGRLRIFPPLGGNTYTEYRGEDQWIRMLFDCGTGPLAFEPATARIGDTLLSEFEHEIEYSHDGPITLYTRNVDEQQLSDALNTDGAVVTRSVTGAKEITLDLSAPALVRYSDKGKKRWVRVAFKVEIKPSASGTWAEVTPTDPDYPGEITGDGDYGIAVAGTATARYSLYGAEARPYRATIRILPSTPGSYDIRITRTSADSAHVGQVIEPDDAYSEFTWTALRAFGSDIAQTVPSNSEMIALAIKVTDQLGRSVDNFSVVAQSQLVGWNGSSYVLMTTRNPAWIYRDILIGVATARPRDYLTQIDEIGLRTWAADCDAKGREFNFVFDQRTSVRDALKAVAAAGRATPARRNGIFGIVQDQPGITPTDLFTDRNGWDPQGEILRRDPVHALKIKFLDEDADWIEDEGIVYADGYSFDGAGGTTVATEFQDLTLVGITKWDRVFEEGRYRIKEAVLRPESFSWTADWDSLRVKPGDVTYRSTDSALLGLNPGGARIKSIAGGSITIDDVVTLAESTSYEVLIRKDTAAVVSAIITTGAGEHSTLALSGGVPSGVQVGDLVAIGEEGKVAKQVLVTHVERQSNLRARISSVPYSPEVHDAGPTAPYDPQINRTPERPPAPVLTSLSLRMARSDEGPRVARGVLHYYIPKGDVPVSHVQGGVRSEDDLRFTKLDRRIVVGHYTFDLPDNRSSYTFRLRSYSELTGLHSEYNEISGSFDDSATGDLPPISVVELVDVPDTRNNRFSTLVITVLPPTDNTRYQTSLVELREVTEARWRSVGNLDAMNQAYAVVIRDGSKYEIRARAVSTRGVVDDGGPSTFYVVSKLADEGPDDALAPFVELNVPNLRIRGQSPAVDTWTGKSLRLQWDHPPSPPAGHRIAYYRVRLRQPITGTLLFQDRTAYARLDYEIETNIRDSFANLDLDDPQRSIDVEVMAFTDAGGRSQAAAEKSAVNAAIAVPAVEVKGLLQAIKLRFATPTEKDYDITEICGSQTAGFTPDPAAGTGNLLIATKDTWPIRIPDLAAGVWYLRIRIRDTFGPGDWSDEIPVTVKGTQDDDSTSPCRLGAFIDGYPGSSMQLLHHVFDEPVLFKAGLAKSKIRTEVAATANWDSVIRRKSAGSWSSIGTGRVATGATTETWTFASDVTFAAGEEIEILAPATVDASLKNPTIHLVGSYV